MEDETKMGFMTAGSSANQQVFPSPSHFVTVVSSSQITENVKMLTMSFHIRLSFVLPFVLSSVALNYSIFFPHSLTNSHSDHFSCFHPTELKVKTPIFENRTKVANDTQMINKYHCSYHQVFDTV